MSLGGFVRRHRVAIATNTALCVALGAVVGYAVHAQGFREHRAELNDGGVWVSNDDEGRFGRMNKPIGRLDADAYVAQDSDLDVIQDGGAVVGIDRSARRLQLINAALAKLETTNAAQVPSPEQVRLAGGTVASVDPAKGSVWATRYDNTVAAGAPQLGAIDSASKPLMKAGAGATMTVTRRGDVIAVSGVEHRLTRAVVTDEGTRFAKPRATNLDETLGAPDQLTSVGEVPVALDTEAAKLSIIGTDGQLTSRDLAGPAMLQQPGAADSSVLVATGTSLLAIDLQTGAEQAIVADQVSGRPAQPVRLGGCVYGAWSGGSGYVVQQCGVDDAVIRQVGASSSDLVFRVNRDQIVLNDRDSGAVWSLDTENPEQIDNWQDLVFETKEASAKDQGQQSNSADRRPPQAKPDNFGARPGRTNVLYPLDNDVAPEGRLLAIRSVDPPSLPGSSVSISPDRQTLQLTLPAGVRGQTSFSYFVDDGRGMPAHAQVSVNVRDDAANGAPALRDAFEPLSLHVPSQGAIEVPVLADWRDRSDSDPLRLESAKVAGQVPGALARPTANGRLRFAAPKQEGTYTVDYAVTDGLTSTPGSVQITVQDPLTNDTFPAVAEPDVVSGETGKPIFIAPLANDLPGSDPSTPNATLALGGEVAKVAGLQVRTDLTDGTVRVLAENPGTYLLDYQAAYGLASLGNGKIRVDVTRPPKQAEPPVAMPDTVTLSGEAGATVDVLANDVDPGGGVLVVTDAAGVSPGQLDVSVLEGRWLRISARDALVRPNPQLVRYRVSNGATSTQGEVQVTQVAMPEDNTPVTADDRVVVRAGATVVAPVLDNDESPSGEPLTLLDDQVTGERAAGQLQVLAGPGAPADRGEAVISGRQVRYTAPSTIAERETFDVAYLAANADGSSAGGTLRVSVVPDKTRNTAPVAPTLEGRLVAGDTVKMRIPGSGIDAEGDPVTVTAITSAPQLGRVVSLGGNTISFQAYPDSAGSEEFTYQVSDDRGATSVGTVRVTVVKPNAPQPPVAVPDTMVAEAGRTLHFNVFANDLVGASDRVEIELVDPPAGARLESGLGPIQLTVPKNPKPEDLTVVYRLTNGLAESRATARVEIADKHNNPPVVHDLYGEAADSDAVTLDLLAGPDRYSAAYDPDGSAEDLVVDKVFADPEIATLSGSQLTVLRGENPRVVAFRVVDPDGGTAIASVFVPATGSVHPFVKPGAVIKIDAGAKGRYDLSDYIVSPEGSTAEFAGENRIWASPKGMLEPRVSDIDTFTLNALSSGFGPGAVLVEVQARTPDAASEPTLLSIPVQIGDSRPILTCPDVPLVLSAGQVHSLDLSDICNVYTPNPADSVGLDYAATWRQQVTGLTFTGTAGSPVLSMRASETATGEAVLQVRAGDSEPDTVTIRLAPIASPRLGRLPVITLNPGDSRTVNVSSFFTPGLEGGNATVLSVSKLSGSEVEASASGSSVTVRAAKKANGPAVFTLTVTDGPATNPAPGRLAEGRLVVEVAGGAPSAPGRPFVLSGKDPGVATLSWQPSKANGAPVDYYEVKELSSGVVRKFPSNRALWKLGKDKGGIAFVVRAVSAGGASPWSERSLESLATSKPGMVKDIKLLDAGDHTLLIGWGAAYSGTKVLKYRITWPGGGVREVDGNTRRLLATGLDNNRTYQFTIRAYNEAGGADDSRVSDPYQSIGTPQIPTGLSVEPQALDGSATSTVITWNPGPMEGPTPHSFSVIAQRVGGSAVTVCARVAANRCVHSGVPFNGAVWTYSVRAHNIQNTSPAATQTWTAIGQPAKWGDWSWSATGQDGQATITFNVPDSRGRESNVLVMVDGAQAELLPGARGLERVSLQGLDDQTPHAVTLKLCNEGRGSGYCSQSGTKSVQTYGPLGGQLQSVQADVSADQVSVAITASGNGKPAELSWTIRGLRSGVVVTGSRTIGVGTETVTTPPASVGYATDVAVSVRLRDPGQERGSDAKDITTKSGPPPTPSISAEKGECTSPQGGSGNCSEWKITVNQSGFIRPWVCRTTYGPYSDSYPASVGRAVTGLTAWTRSGTTLTCHTDTGEANDPEYQEASVRIEW